MTTMPHFLRRPSRLVLGLLAAACLPLAGCGYTIHGRVVRGEMGIIDWMPGPGDASGEPVAGAVVTVVRDPNGMHPEEAGRATSGPDGSFTLSVSGFGAGWMDEMWLIKAAKGGVGTAEWTDHLPGSPSGQTLVVTLAPSANNGPQGAYDAMWKGDVGQGESAESLMKEAEKYR